MATLDQTFNWLINNPDKKGTKEYDDALLIYQYLRQEEAGEVPVDDSFADGQGMPATQADFDDRFGDVAPTSTPLMSGEEDFTEEVVVEEPDTVSDIAGGLVRGLAPTAAGTLVGGIVGGPPGAIAGAAAGTLAPFVGDPVVSSINSLLGTNYTLPTDALQDFLTRVGVTDPQTEAGRIAEAVGTGIGGAVGGATLGKTLMEAPGTLGRVGGSLASQPGAQIAGGVGAGAAAQTTAELGGGPWWQIVSALLGGVGGAGLKSLTTVPGRLKSADLELPTKADIDIAAAQQADIPVMTSDIRPPRTFAGHGARQAGERIPFIGTGPVRHSQEEARIAAVRDLLRQYGSEDVANLADDVMSDLLKQRQSFLTKFINQKEEVINRLSSRGSVDVSRTLKKIDDEIASLQALSRGEQGINFGPLIDDLERARFSLQDQDLKSIESLRKLLGEKYKDPNLASVASQAQKVYNSLYRPLVDDMSDFIKLKGDPKDFTKWKVANKRLAESIGELNKSGGLKAVLNKGDVTPELIEKLLFSKKPSEVRLLYKNLSEEGRAKARAAILGRAAEKSASEEATGTVVSPQKFKEQVKALGASIGVMFKGAELDQVRGLARILNLTKRASEAGVSPATGIQNWYNLTLMGLGAGTASAGFLGGMSGLGSTLGAVASFAAFTRAYESAAVRNILIKLSKTKKNSKEEAKILKRLMAAEQQHDYSTESEK